MLYTNSMTNKEISTTPGQLKPTDVSSPFRAKPRTESGVRTPQALHTLGTTNFAGHLW